MLLDQKLPMSIQVWRGQSQEAKRGSAGGPRITRNLQRLGRCSSRMRPPGCLCSRWGPEQCHSSAAAMDVCSDAPTGGNGLSARRMAVWWTFRASSLCRHVHRELRRSGLLELTPIIHATACHQSNYVERYSRYRHSSLLLRLLSCLAHGTLPRVSGPWGSGMCLPYLNPHFRRLRLCTPSAPASRPCASSAAACLAGPPCTYCPRR